MAPDAPDPHVRRARRLLRPCPPPKALAPDSIGPDVNPGEKTYDGFARYGFRVPSMLIGPYAKPNHVSHVVYDHTSILAFVEHKWNLPAMTKRDANANNLLDFLDLGAIKAQKPTSRSCRSSVARGMTPRGSRAPRPARERSRPRAPRPPAWKSSPPGSAIRSTGSSSTLSARAARLPGSPSSCARVRRSIRGTRSGSWDRMHSGSYSRFVAESRRRAAMRSCCRATGATSRRKTSRFRRARRPQTLVDRAGRPRFRPYRTRTYVRCTPVLPSPRCSVFARTVWARAASRTARTSRCQPSAIG